MDLSEGKEMKLNEKIKKYRKIFDLSQEQLAEKLNVSRQVITKWESDNGLPDIENLKQLSKTFNVSIDYLLNDNEEVTHPVLRETYELEKNNYSNRYDYAVSYLKKNYPEPSIIYGLSQSKDLTTLEWITDFIINPGIIDAIHWLNEFAIWFLVEKETQSLLIKVTKEYIETKEISNIIDKKKFVHEKNKFTRLNKIS
jgi:transcriptional regulator with XRE-family HTH domain